MDVRTIGGRSSRSNKTDAGGKKWTKSIVNQTAAAEWDMGQKKD